jgi:hypothetical protein
MNRDIKHGIFIAGAVIAAILLAWIFLGVWGLGMGIVVGGGYLAIWYMIIRPKEEQGIVTGLVNLGFNKSQFGGIAPRGTTPSGCPIFSTVDVPLNAQKNLEIGVQNQINRYDKLKSWPNRGKVSEYAFVFVNPNADTDGMPALNVNVDFSTRVKTAGTVIGLQPHTGPKREYIVLPHQAAEGWKYNDYLMHAAWFESEHVREWANDLNEFVKYAIAGDVHPHADPEGVEVIAAI